MNKEIINRIKLLVNHYSDKQIGKQLKLSKDQIYRLRKKYKIERTVNFQKPELVNFHKDVKKISVNKKTLILTAWEIRVKPDENFINIINNIARDSDAQKICIPIWAEDIRYMPEIIKNNFDIGLDNFDINSNLHFEYVPTHALVTSPTAQWKSFSHKSTIIPALLKDLQTLPSIKLPKLIATTGSIGRLNAFQTDYNFIEDEDLLRSFIKRWSNVTNRRGGNIYAAAKHFIEPSALIVEIYDDKYFNVRYISMPTDKVYDLNKVYYADGRIGKNTPKALILGDLHAYNKDEVEYKKSLEMIKYFEPESVYIQDVFDGCSINHHEIHSTAKNIKFPDLDTEAEITRNIILEICGIANQVKYLQSNHDNFVTKFLDDENAWKINRNYITALELQLFRIKENRHPIIKLLDLDSIDNLEFIPENARHFIGETLVEHGHQGVSGRRAGFLELSKLYGSFICGHFHSAKIFRNAVQVGKIIRSDIEYASTGASNWICCNAVLNSDNSKQLLFIVNGTSIIDLQKYRK